ncbi:ATP-dependent DNA helicase RecG [Parafrigoribacterium mesophilum]|uniref:ATP-dependent DNA helicase RecG n=1 Tax=Parafrigoribacterium mesophilum TaxID=433646 RepID=UPI0031FBEB30
MDSALDAKLSTVLGGRTAAALFKAFGLSTVADLLGHYPRRYARRGELTALSELELDENVTIVAEVVAVSERKMRSKRGSILEARISDGSGLLTLTFFNQTWRAKELRPGVRGIFAGKIGTYHHEQQLAHPNYELFEPDAQMDDDAGLKYAQQPIPLYPATSSVTSWQLHRSIGVVLDTLGDLPDPIPDEVRSERGLIKFRRALELIHRPQQNSDWGAARKALRFREAFLLQAALLQQRALLRAQPAEPRLPEPGGFLERFDERLPFALTGDQHTVGAELASDLASAVPMNRLLQGEVGSGKTLVALRGMLAVADSGGQSALLAPTEVLAAQHLRSIVQVLGPDLAAELRPTLITGQLPQAVRKKALLSAISGQSHIVVGTHALLSESVGFYDLGLIVVDEQHRFGVEQREALRRKGSTPPHTLVLTATPIPRTVAMTVFGDLDISTIAELPSGRVPIVTHVVPLAEKPGWSGRIWARVAEEVAQGRQVFVVCPAIDAALVEEDAQEPLDLMGDGARIPLPRASVTGTLDELRQHPLLASMRIEALHGRLPGETKDEIMRAFAAGEIDVLVATTVIEVGVDVPNASTMVILDADRFGVSQLHQLRGRVGRGAVPGLCLMVTHAETGMLGRERVEAVAATLDGFELAQADLELRQEGDVLGSAQSGGHSSLKLLRVAKDGTLISDARAIAQAILDADPPLSAHTALRDALARRLDDQSRDFLAKN